MPFKQFPALTWGVLAGVVSGVLAAWQAANATGTTNWLTLAVAVIPIVAGVLTHQGVVPVGTVRDIITRARSAAAAVSALADQVDVAVDDRPPAQPA